jgi:hypothetical protein
MTISTLNKLKVPIIKVNSTLNALKNIPMFEDKIEAANAVLRLVGLPKPIQKASYSVKKNQKHLKKRRFRRLKMAV